VSHGNLGAADVAAGKTWEREDFNALRVMYPAEVLVGQPWTCIRRGEEWVVIDGEGGVRNARGECVMRDA
jgi:hypothetical protein